MFVPRALRLKGIKESQKRKQQEIGRAESAADTNAIKNEELLVESMDKISTTSPAPQPDEIDHQSITRGPRFTETPVTPESIAQLGAGVELIFTDYAHQHPESAKWLREHYRTIDGEDNCELVNNTVPRTCLICHLVIHLMSILEHPSIANLKPQPTQGLIRQAVQKCAVNTLELSGNGFHVRRRPSTYPCPFIPPNSFHITNDDGLSFWDQRTIYVEPHIRHMCKTPPKVAHWLIEHGQVRAKWLPIQAVHTLYNSCAFVVLSGSVMHEDVWNKWRDVGKPEDWNIMTKAEHTERTEEYRALLKKEKAELRSKGYQKRKRLADDAADSPSSKRSG